jgi:SAM-dependent methyltransferase
METKDNPSETSKALYEAYPADVHYMERYIQYQRQYFRDARESDKKIIRLLLDSQTDAGGDLLDIGCSTGALLYHIGMATSKFRLFGGDLSESQLADCRANTSLKDVTFQHMDIRSLPESAFDVVIANAVLYGFEDDDLKQALSSIRRSLRAGGRLIAFDFYHDFSQELSIVEKSTLFPNGHPLHFRSQAWMNVALQRSGFSRWVYHPFAIPIDLPRTEKGSLQTYTVSTRDDQRLQFRGSLFQPWCHLIAELETAS